MYAATRPLSVGSLPVAQRCVSSKPTKLLSALDLYWGRRGQGLQQLDAPSGTGLQPPQQRKEQPGRGGLEASSESSRTTTALSELRASLLLASQPASVPSGDTGKPLSQEVAKAGWALQQLSRREGGGPLGASGTQPLSWAVNAWESPAHYQIQKKGVRGPCADHGTVHPGGAVTCALEQGTPGLATHEPPSCLPFWLSVALFCLCIFVSFSHCVDPLSLKG